MGRRSIRLSKYDYAQSGAYFVTICSHNQLPILGRIMDGEIVLSQEGTIVMRCLDKIPDHFTNATLDTYVIMPNHIHMIVVLSRGEASDENDGIFPIASRSDASPLQSEGTKPRGTKSGSLGAIIQNFKSVSTRKINQDHNTPGECVWQRNYFEHIIRTERSLNAIRHYIKTNPIRWELDRYNPNAVGSDREAEALWYLLREKKMPAELERMMWQD